MPGDAARDFLLEIGSEELPWGAVQDGREQLQANLATLLERERLSWEGMEVYSTPRRLAVLVRGLAGRQADLETEVRGPSRSAAFDGEGRPTAAAEGFARSRGVRVEDLQVRETGKGEFVFAVVREEGRPAIDVLPGLLEELMRSFSFRKSMRWGSGEFRFARPVRWLVDDAAKFTAREVRRGRRYDGIILDPPKFGRGPEGEVWRLEDHLPGLVHDCATLLDSDSRFLFLTVYAVRMSSLAIAGLLAEACADLPGVVEHGDLAVQEDGPEGRLLPTAIFARWRRD
jgi:hypothetical protein